MKKLLPMFAVAVLCGGLTLGVRAADEKVTITGEGQCAKCALGETNQCQNAVVVEKDGVETVYYMPTDNPVAKQFHRNICQGTKPIKVVGTVKEENGKKILVPEEIALVEN